jgi:hypothetical protein
MHFCRRSGSFCMPMSYQLVLYILSVFCVCVCVCVCVALGVQHVMRMRHISYVACRAVLYFSTLSHKGHDFLRKIELNTKCVF